MKGRLLWCNENNNNDNRNDNGNWERETEPDITIIKVIPLPVAGAYLPLANTISARSYPRSSALIRGLLALR